MCGIRGAGKPRNLPAVSQDNRKSPVSPRNRARSNRSREEGSSRKQSKPGAISPSNSRVSRRSQDKSRKDNRSSKDHPESQENPANLKNSVSRRSLARNSRNSNLNNQRRQAVRNRPVPSSNRSKEETKIEEGSH